MYNNIKNFDLHRPEEAGSLHSLFERRDPDLEHKEDSCVPLSNTYSSWLRYICNVSLCKTNTVSVGKQG